MSTSLPMLTDAQWSLVVDLFQKASEKHRITISAMLWICANRKGYLELPRQYGKPANVRYRIWHMRQIGIASKVLARLGIVEWYPVQTNRDGTPRKQKNQ